jgi:hypothetical protein
MKWFIFIGIILLVLNFGIHSHRQGDRQIPAVTLLIAFILIIVMFLI